MPPRLDSNDSHASDEPIGMPECRTVNDYETEEEVVKALKECDLSGGKDWVLNKFDKETTIKNPNSIKTEAKRLLCLKSYNLLDTEQESEFEDITNEAKKYFDCPIVVVSLVDMGRQWFKSIQGLPVESTPRCLSFCAHVVKRKEREGILVVPDATKDPRFSDHALVVGGPEIRFYAGAPLVTPEGHRLGSICVIDTKPHPEGLNRRQKQQLEKYASECIFHMIARGC